MNDLKTVYEGKWVEGLAGRNVHISRVTQDHGVFISHHGAPSGHMNAEQLASFGFKALTTEEVLEGQDYPKVGEDIYVDTALYIERGQDDFHGGLCRVAHIRPGVSAGKIVPYVRVEEKPNSELNWAYLATKQGELKAKFGTDRGYPDPDYG